MYEETKRFRANGYFILENIIDHSLLDSIIYLISKRFTLITGIKFKEEVLINGKLSEEFEDNIINFRLNDPEKFGFLYDSIQSSVNLSQLLLNNDLIQNACKITGYPSEDYSTSGHIQRIDPPTDKKNLYEWHQETSYYRQNKDGNGCFFIWIPLFDVNEENGTVIIAKSSHKKGYINTELIKNEKLGSEQRNIDDDLVKDCELINLNMKKGDACLIDFNTMHKSGHNKTKHVRFTAIGRYHFSQTKHFRPFRYKFMYNDLNV
tara:strand:+ start:136 stop:924 length:789 start_codon:yes stop_codon:yes gene_type:complete